MRLHLISLIAAAATACSTTVAFAQTQIPFKPGLWQSNVTSSISGMQISPEMQARIAQMSPEAQEKLRGMMGGAPRTTVMQSCMTKEQFDKWNDQFSEQRSKDEQCTHTNVEQDAQKRSFDVTCTSPTSKSTGHVEMFIDSDEKSHGSMHMVRTATQGSQAMQPITVDVKFDTHFSGSDCGDIKPGDARPLKQ